MKLTIKKGQITFICLLKMFPFIFTRITLLFILLTLLPSFTTHSYSQDTSITMNLREVTLEEALNVLKEENGFSFWYRNEEINLQKKVSIEAQQLDIDQVIKQLLQGQDVSYRIEEKHIIIYKKNPPSFSQQEKKQISGTIKDLQGEAVIGANIVEEGTSNGVITDIDGNFTISVNPGAVLVVSFIGYIPQKLEVATTASFDILLAEDLQTLDEVIIIGYGTTRRKDFTGSVSSFKLENSPMSLTTNLNALESLKGNITGLDIGGVNSAGGSPSIQIRGKNSISGSNDPLIVLDGVIFMGSISDINPNDIASFDILKDATSAAAYGSRSANGVIIISTKRGKIGKPIIQFNLSGSMQTWHRQPKLMNGEQWLNMVRDKNKYEDYSFLTSQQEINYNAGKEVDWLDTSTRTGWIKDYQLAVSGAAEKMNYYLSFAYSGNQGIVIGDEYARTSILGKMETHITNWLKIGMDAAYTHSDYSGLGANIDNATILSPYDMLYRDESRKLPEKYPNGQSGTVNTMWGVDSDILDDLDVRNNIRGNAFMVVECPWIQGLSYRLNYAGNLDYKRTGRFYHESYYTTIGPYDDESRYSITAQQNYLASANGNVENTKTNSWVLDNILNYTNTFGRHSIDLTAVATRDSRTYKIERMEGNDFYSNGNTLLGIDGLHYAKTQKIMFNNVKRRNIGYFARASYSWNNTYYLTGSYRRDGASVFGTQNKWGNFGAVGGAWRITNEKFMKNYSFLNDVKLKLSWGKNGNQGIEPYGTLSRTAAGSSGGIFYTFGNNGEPAYGIKQQEIGNTNLGWETTEAWNTGFESVWLNNRLFVDLDIYFSRTYDQIFTRTIPVMTGFTSMKSSMGEVQNRGFEMTLRSVNIQKANLTWTTNVTFWLNRNKLTHLYGEDLDGDGKEDDDIGNSLFIGHSISSIYGYKQNGIVQPGDTDYMAANGVEAGTPKYVDMNGDGIITIEDRTIVANKDPRFKLNMSNTLNWKNWELYIMLTGTFGGNGYYQQSNKPAFMAGGRGDYFGANNIYIPYWTTDNLSNKYPAAWFLGDNYFLGLQSRAYVRLQNVTLSYSFNQPFIRNAGINTLKIFFTGNNLATITGWKGGDPELGNSINFPEQTWPVATTLSIGANISF